MTCWSFVWAQPCFNKQVPVRVCEHTCVFKMGQGFWFYLILSPGSFFLFSFDLFLYWRMIALQNFVVFCQTSTWISRAAAAKSLQSCPTLYDPIDGSPPGSPVPGILQARTLEWVAISFSNAWKWKVKVKSLSHGQLFVGLSQLQTQPYTISWLLLDLCIQYPSACVFSSLETHGSSSPSKDCFPQENFPSCLWLKGILLFHKEFSCSRYPSHPPPRDQICPPYTLTNICVLQW